MTRRPNKIRLVGIPLLVLAIILGSSCFGAPVTFLDNTFSGADWELSVFRGLDGGAVAAQQESLGGNPGFYRRVTDTVNGYCSGYSVCSWVWGCHVCVKAVYDQRVQGAIATIDYAEDSIMFVGFGQGQATGPLLVQNGVFYCGPSMYANQMNWYTQNLVSLHAADFSSLGGQHPDFSAAGNPIVFGFYRRNSGGPYSGPGYTIVAGIDNWTVTVHPVEWRVPGDVNSDCAVNVLDLIQVRNHLGADVAVEDNWKYDVNQDGKVNILDLIFVRNRLGKKCSP
jgi:hypothetical protein